MAGLTLRQIEAFRAVMVAGSVTRAAEVLGISQPSASRIIADLEAFVGVTLFERRRRRLEPTEAARAFFIEVERSLRGLGHLNAVARELQMHRQGRLNLIIVPSILPLITDTLLAGFVADNRDVKLSVEVQTTSRTIEWMVAEQADIGITTDPTVDPGLIAHRLGSVQAVCLLPRGHRLANAGRTVSVTDLANEPLVGFMPETFFRIQFERLMAAKGLAPHYLAEARTSAAVCQIAAGLGAAALIPVGFRDPWIDDRLVVRPFTPAMESRVTLVHAANRPPTRVAAAFVDHARRVAEQGWPARDMLAPDDEGVKDS